MSKGTNNYQWNSNRKYTIQNWISYRLQSFSPKMKWQATLAQHNVALLDAQQPRENALKGGVDI